MFGRKSRNKPSGPTADTPIPDRESRDEIDVPTSDTSTSTGNSADAARETASAEGESHEVQEKSAPSLSYGAIDHRGLDPWDEKSRGSSNASDSRDLDDLQAMDDLDDIPTVAGSRPVKPASSASSAATPAESETRAGNDDPRDDHADNRGAGEPERVTAHDVPHDVASSEPESEVPSDEDFAADELTVVEQRSRGRRDIYSLTGRAAPQVITPREQSQEAKTHDPLFDQPEDIPGARSTSDEDAVFANAPVSDLNMATMDEEEPASATPASADRSASPESASRYAPHDTYVDRPDEQINETRVDMPTSGAYDRDHVDRAHYSDDRQGDRVAAGLVASDGVAGEYRDGAVPLGEDDDRPVDSTGDVDVDDEIYEDEDPRRGTTDFGLFLIRLALGAMLLFYGVRTLFELGGSSGVDGLHNDFYFMKGNELLAWAVPIIETAAGAFLVLGVLAPLGACMAVAVSSFMAMYSIDLQPGAFSPFNMAPHVQVWVLLTALSIGVAFSGPGRWGVDATRGWARRPLGSGWFSTIIGLLAGAAVWVVVAQSNPFN